MDVQMCTEDIEYRCGRKMCRLDKRWRLLMTSNLPTPLQPKNQPYYSGPHGQLEETEGVFLKHCVCSCALSSLLISGEKFVEYEESRCTTWALSRDMSAPLLMHQHRPPDFALNLVANCSRCKVNIYWNHSPRLSTNIHFNNQNMYLWWCVLVYSWER